MDARKNPFTPGAGAQPPELAGRASILSHAELSLVRLRDRVHTKSMIVVGLRGAGKTCIINSIHHHAQKMAFHAALLEAREGKTLAELLLPALHRFLNTPGRLPSSGASDSARRALRIMRSFLGSLDRKAKGDLGRLELDLAIAPETGTADSGNFELDLSALLQAVAEFAAEHQLPIALCIDEIQALPEQELAALIVALDRVSQRRLPLILVAAGLPQARGLASRARSDVERLVEYPEIGPLQPWHVSEALQGPAQAQGAAFSREALNEIIKATHGFAYFLQQWGYEAWNLASGSTIEAADIQRATKSAIRRLDETFFRVRFDHLTPKEKEYLRAMAELGPPPQRSGQIAAQLGLKIQAVAPVRDALMRKGMVYSPAYGQNAFTAPLFDEFLRRAMPSSK
jgi:hypothetical protein